MRINDLIIVAVAINLLASQAAYADTPSAFGSGFDVQEFYKPFTLEEITPENQQKWPYYKYVSAHWDDYALHGTVKIEHSANPASLLQGQRLDMNYDSPALCGEQCGRIRTGGTAALSGSGL